MSQLSGASATAGACRPRTVFMVKRAAPSFRLSALRAVHRHPSAIFITLLPSTHVRWTYGGSLGCLLPGLNWAEERCARSGLRTAGRRDGLLPAITACSTFSCGAYLALKTVDAPFAGGRRDGRRDIQNANTLTRWRQAPTKRAAHARHGLYAVRRVHLADSIMTPWRSANMSPSTYGRSTTLRHLRGPSFFSHS